MTNWKETQISLHIGCFLSCPAKSRSCLWPMRWFSSPETAGFFVCNPAVQARQVGLNGPCYVVLCFELKNQIGDASGPAKHFNFTHKLDKAEIVAYCTQRVEG